VKTKKCQHNQIGVYVVIHKYLVSNWEDTGEMVDEHTVYRRKVVEKIKCPHCGGLFLRGFFEIELFDE
jgi:hypothetical protein